MLIKKTKALKTGMNITIVFQASSDANFFTGEKQLNTAIMEAGYNFIFDYPGSTTTEFIPNEKIKKPGLHQ